jgi:hypothetical protein
LDNFPTQETHQKVVLKHDVVRAVAAGKKTTHEAKDQELDERH